MKYIIQALTEHDTETGQPLYWSNDDGWVDRTTATEFDSTDFNLPVGGKWVPIALTQYELDRNHDGTVQLRLFTPEGIVDLMFVDSAQFIGLVAGQHVATAQRVMESAIIEVRIPKAQPKDRHLL